MSSTNKTANLELSQFIGSDKPAWLVDYNGDMQKIDAGVASVKSQADATDLVVAGHGTSINNLQSASSDQSAAITQLRTDVNANTGSINTINSLIGNGEPTTTDKTIIGAINEIYADITGGGTVSVQAADVDYDNTTSGLTADDVQEAIDEIVSLLPSTPVATKEVQRGTLAAGSTSVALTFTDITIGATTLIDIFTDDFDVVPTAVSVAGQVVTLTFDSQAAAIAVAVKAEN